MFGGFTPIQIPDMGKMMGKGNAFSQGFNTGSNMMKMFKEAQTQPTQTEPVNPFNIKQMPTEATSLDKLTIKNIPIDYDTLKQESDYHLANRNRVNFENALKLFSNSNNQNGNSAQSVNTQTVNQNPFSGFSTLALGL
jgi:hypothetical protein